MKYTLPLAIGAIGLMLGSCASERTTFVKGNAIEWQAKNALSVEDPMAVVMQETAASTASASLDNSSSPVEIVSQLIEQAPVSEAPATAQNEEGTTLNTSTVAVPGSLAIGVSETAASVSATSTVASPSIPKPGSGGKSQLVALLLCFFVGGIGIHRFYLGYTWQGIVQILTLGGLGVWVLIDFIRIIMGTLKPKDGEYEKTL